MDQQDLFGGETRPAYTPKPEHVRNHLRSILNELAGSDAWPWDEVIVDLHTERTVPYLLSLMEAGEAAEWRAKFEAEVTRLSRSAAA